ncbi:DNA ligase D [Cognatiluteimonas weifangensis]|uniref:DNA ligase (ATP) n=1 Tax=Cognatiluteimonas weifangensis TaxID=2303539 RepID=A0A372DNB3_9GAMM|nr:DNA ligase D [Luteimonas weifangensis]RFP61053.1 DNA ligase D [Luteimonas weifangensis]
MSLREYARKRRFGDTPEPGDDAAPGKRGRRPIFVVQLHQARARHYDFRLEMDGTLKSWAVPKGPSFRVGERRLAVEVEDHPLRYADFEGDIPKGQYGAGHVDIFDRGVWSAEGDPLEALATGKIDFVLHGERLHGGWKLVRTAQVRSGKPQWLLFKRDDAWAGDLEADDLLDGQGTDANGSWEGTARATGKRSAKAAKKATPAGRPRARPRRVDWAARAAALAGARRKPRGWKPPAPQLATLRAAPPAGDDWLHELKWDGYRLLVDVAGGRAKLRSRNGLDWTPDYPDLVKAFEALGADDATFDGELVALTPQGNDDFGLLQKAISGSSNAPLRCMLFDLPSLGGYDLAHVALEDRKALLAELLGDADPVLALSRHIAGHGAEVFAASKRQGMEGIVSKRHDARYVEGRSTTWLKSKHAQGDEFVIVGYTAPKRSRTGFGSLLLATHRDGALQYVGRVGTGFDDAMLRHLAARMRPLARREPTVPLPAHVPFRPRDVTWIAPLLVVELEYRGWGKEGLLRQASFKGLREDKGVDEIGDADARGTTKRGTTKRAPAKTAATGAARQRAPAADPGGGLPRVSSPGRIVYPQLRITKQRVFDYYRQVAPLLLPELRNRPLSLVRCPDGVRGPCFFQKHHAATLGGSVRSVPIREKDGGSEDYVYVDDVAGLLELVQMNVLEFHPWGARIEDVEHPDRLVFDLDPGEGVDWNAIRAAAREIRARLREAGLEGFLRLSGGKGLHVVVPLAPKADWATAKAFCEAFARAMEAQAPQRYVATATKARRKGVIFIDWLRNGRGATSVASWSLRARPEAGVAVPLAWSELGRTKSGKDFPLDRALRRAAGQRSDPWQSDGWREALRQTLPEL